MPNSDSPEAKKRKAINLVREHGVISALEFYLNKVHSSLHALYDDFAEGGLIQNISKNKDGCSFEIRDNKIQLEASGWRSGELADAKYGDFVLSVNDENVFETGVTQHYDEWGTGDIHISDYDFRVKKLKLTKEWVACIVEFGNECKNIVNNYEDRKKKEEEKRKAEEIEKNIDLGDFE